MQKHRHWFTSWSRRQHLAHSSKNNRIKLIQEILTFKPNLAHADGNGNTALHWTIMLTEMPLIKELKYKNIIEQKNAEGKTPLALSSEMEFGIVFDWLFKLPADIYKVDNMHNCILHLVCKPHDTRILRSCFKTMYSHQCQQTWKTNTAPYGM